MLSFYHIKMFGFSLPSLLALFIAAFATAEETIPSSLPDVSCKDSDVCLSNREMELWCDNTTDYSTLPTCNAEEKCFCAPRPTPPPGSCNADSDCGPESCMNSRDWKYPYCAGGNCACSGESAQCRSLTCKEGMTSSDNMETCTCLPDNYQWPKADPGACSRDEDCPAINCVKNTFSVHRACRKGRCTCKAFGG